MFLQFFYLLRAQGLRVSFTEWMTLTEALAQGLAQSSLARFYYLCRAICVKKESSFDMYDQCFAHYFRDVSFSKNLHDELKKWLENPKFPRTLSDQEKKELEQLDLDQLRDLFEQRLNEQRERHDGGNRWIGTGGTSPFGHGGYHPSGIRLGGAGSHNRAMQVAEKRRFVNLRQDRILDTRSMSQALRKLRVLGREGSADELDLEETISATAKNAGDITMVFRPERRNAVHLLLLMDVGGSMTPYTRITERLFSAAHQANHFRAFKYYYFHNTPYETLYSDMEMQKGRPTSEVLNEIDERWHLMMVGDAAMSPYELTERGGSVDYFHYNEKSGVEWLQRIKTALPNSLWYNPEPVQFWQRPSTQIIRQVFPMFPLSINGLEEGIDFLRQRDNRLSALHYP